MSRISVTSFLTLILLCCVLPLFAQQPSSTATNPVVPPMVNFSGVIRDAAGKPSSTSDTVLAALAHDERRYTLRVSGIPCLWSPSTENSSLKERCSTEVARPPKTPEVSPLTPLQRQPWWRHRQRTLVFCDSRQKPPTDLDGVGEIGET